MTGRTSRKYDTVADLEIPPSAEANQDAFGSVTAAWVVAAPDLFVSIEPVAGTEGDENGQDVGTQRFRVELRRPDVAITTAHRFRIYGGPYDGALLYVVAEAAVGDRRAGTVAAFCQWARPG